MAERAVAEVVGERQGLGQVLVEPEHPRQRSRNLRHLEAVGQPGAEMVTLEIDQHLGLVLEPAERGGMNNPIPVALKGAAQPARRLVDQPATARAAHGSMGRPRGGAGAALGCWPV